MRLMLSREERERFAAWLEQDAQGTEWLIEQMMKLPGTEMLAKMKRSEVLAQKIVARMLRSIEDMSV